MESAKVTIVLNWSEPTNIKQLRAFLGLIGYYRKFVKNYASIAAPLTKLLKKDQFNWSVQATSAFNQLKKAIIEALIQA